MNSGNGKLVAGRSTPNRRSATSGVAFSVLLFGACPGPGGGDSAVDAAVDAPDAQVVSCADDEALDLQYDKSMDINCSAVRAAVDARRSPADRLQVAALAESMRNNLPRCCVSRAQLVDFMRSPTTLVQLDNDEQRRAYDRAVGMLLCDSLTREIQTRAYVASHPSCLAGEPPNGDVLPGAAGGAR
jgi:hypothetical protein